MQSEYPSSAIHRSPPKLVGRTSELAAIDLHLRRATSGLGSALFFLGEAGAGKTRLLREAMVRGRSSGMAVLSSSSPSVIALPPFGALAQALRSVTRQKSFDANELRSFAPGLRLALPEWPVMPSEPLLTGEQLRLLVLEGVLQLLLRAAGSDGALLVLDDLQWADAETIEFVHHAAAAVESERLLILGAIRTGDDCNAEKEVQALVQADQATAFEISGLDRQGTSVLMTQVVGLEPPASVVDRVFAVTDGNALLVEELVEAMLRTGAIRREGGIVDWSHLPRSIVPRGIASQVRQRLAQLSGDARRLVRAAAVLGRFDLNLIAFMLERPFESLEDALDLALSSGILEPREGISFRHALIKDAVAETVAPDQRRHMHRRAAKGIEALPSKEDGWLEEMARHLEQAGETEQASKVLLSIARENLRRYSPASAETVLQRALSLPHTEALDTELRDALAESLAHLGRWEEALDLDLTSALTVIDWRRFMRMGRNAVMLGRLEEARSFIESSAKLPESDAGELEALSALEALWRGDFRRAVERGRVALAIAEERKDQELMCRALDVIGRGLDESGERREAVEVFRHWATVAERAGLTASHLQALMELGNVEFMSQGSPDGLRETRQRAREAGAFVTLVLADLSLVWCLSARGELAEAVEAGEEAEGDCRRFRLDLLPFAMTAAAWARGRRLAGSGDDAAHLVIEHYAGEASIEAHEVLADSALRTGRYAEALRQFDESRALLQASPSPLPAITPFLRVAALLASKRKEDALAALEEVGSLPSRFRLYYNDFWFQAGSALAHGSDAGLERCVDGSTNAEFEGAVALVLASEVLGGPKAEGWLRRAFRAFERFGAESDMARVRELLAKRGARLQRSRRRSNSTIGALKARGVSSREAEVLAFVAAGLSNGQIADRLVISRRTVESHVASLMGKLGVRNRADLISMSAHLQLPVNHEIRSGD